LINWNTKSKEEDMDTSDEKNDEDCKMYPLSLNFSLKGFRNSDEAKVLIRGLLEDTLKNKN